MSEIKNLISREGPLPARRTLAEEAADKLRELIILEKIPPGTAVPERDVAAGLGISRTPLKAALRILEQEGLIEYSPSRRPRVANPSLEVLSENLAVLGALEALAGELACLRAENAEIDALAGLSEQMHECSKASTPLDFFKLDMAFHQTIVRASRNEPLITTHMQYNARLWRARFISSRMHTRRDNTLHEHQQIASALQARNPDRTATALRLHLKTTIENITNTVHDAQTPETQKERRS